MIAPVSGGAGMVSRPVSAARSLPQADPVDGFTRSEPVGAARPRRWRLGGFSLASTVLMACMLTPGAAPLMAQAGKAVASDTLKPSGEDEKALQQALAGEVGTLKPLDDVGRARLATLPPEMQAQYGQMDAKAKFFMAGRLQGSKSFLGVTLLNYRKAFIKGEAYGHDVFEFVSGKVDEKMARGELSESQGTRTKAFLEACSHLTPAQRETLVGLLEFETGLGKKKR